MSDSDHNRGDNEDDYDGVDEDGSNDGVAEAAQWLREDFEKPARSDSKEGEKKHGPSFAVDPRALDAVAKIFRSLGENFLEESIAFHVLDDRIRFTVCYRRTIVTAEAHLLEPAGAAAKSRFGLKVSHLIGVAKHFHDQLTCELSADSSYLEVTSGKTKPSPTNRADPDQHRNCADIVCITGSRIRSR